MRPTGRYLLGSLYYAAGYYIVGLMLSPSPRSPVAGLLGALSFGLIMRAFLDRQERLSREGKQPFPPVLYFGTGLLGLGFCAWCWRTLTPSLSVAEWAGVLGGAGFSLVLLACGFTVARHR